MNDVKLTAQVADLLLQSLSVRRTEPVDDAEDVSKLSPEDYVEFCEQYCADGKHPDAPFNPIRNDSDFKIAMAVMLYSNMADDPALRRRLLRAIVEARRGVAVVS